MLHSIPLGILSFSSGGYAVDNSAVFNDDDSEYLTFLPAQAPTSDRICTLSFWVKRGSIGNAQKIITQGQESGGVAESIHIYFHSDDRFIVLCETAAGAATINRTTTQVFRDPHAWYHFCIRINGYSSGDSACIIEVNGATITAFDTKTNPSSSTDLGTFNNVEPIQIGRLDRSPSGTYADFYLAQFIGIDGGSYDATKFGEYDDNGVWRPIDPTDNFTVSSTAEAIANSASATNSSGLTTYTYSGVALGTASSTRAVYVFATGQGPASSNFDVSSMTVGGVSATRVADVTNSAEAQYVSELWRADVPSGTTGDIVVVWNSAMSQCGVIAWAVTGDHNLFDLQTTSDSTASFTLSDIPDGSVILAGRGGTGSRTHTWSSDVTENVDEVIGSGVVQSGASSAKSTGGDFTVTCTPSTSDTRARTVSIVLSPTQGAGINGFYLPFSAGTGAALGSNSAGSNTFTPAAANYTYNSTYTTIGSGTIDNNGAPGVSGRLNNPFSGDFTFSFTATAIAGSIFGCFDADELSTFATGTDDGGLDSMTKSWWYDDGGNGSGGAGSVGAGKIMYGNATQASSAIAAGSAVTITRTGSTIKITDDGSDLHSFSQTHAGPVYIMIGHRNITSKSMNFDSVSMAGSEAFAAVNSPTQTTDSPTTNFATLSSVTEVLGAAVTLSDGNLSAAGTAATVWNRNPASISLQTAAGGKYIWAVKPNAVGGGRGDPWITNESYGGGNNPQTQSNAWTATIDTSSAFIESDAGTTTTHSISPVAATGDYILCAIDLDNNKVWWGLYDVSADTTKWADNSTGFSGDPTDGGTTANATLTGDTLSFGISVYTGRSCEVDFGQGVHDLLSNITIPTGYKFINAANLFEASAPTIGNPDDHFKEVIVDHDGSSTNFTIPWSTYNGTSGTYDTLFSIKRLADEKWFVIDSIRGLNKYFSWNATTSQTTDANVLSVSGTTGTLGSTLADDNYLVQMYRLNAQSSRDTSNSEGSITGGSNSLIISANATAGWSVCTYTGTGANGTFGHGLSQAPEWIRWYNTVSADGQTVYHAFNSSTPKDHYGNFDSAPTTLTNDDSTKFNDTAPTADVNSVGSADSTNGSSDAMWCFSVHSVNSFSKVGAFVGNGGADGPFAEASISPKSVVLKNANGNATGDDWILVTDTRFLYNADASTLAFNLTATEQATNLFDILSNGIKLRTTNAAVNENNNTIVYHMIGSPFAGTTPATAR
tara:strand:- start:4068 stop:7736 length:3669 start_codon:yes stop_codon:yes gene_type:complete